LNDLKNENKNLKENLKLNKEIIEKFYLDNNKGKDRFFNEKLQQENKNLLNHFDIILQENIELRNKVYSILKNFIN